MKRVMIVLAGSAFLLAGCGRGNEQPSEAPPDTPATVPAASTQRITLHVKDMVERQGLT